MSANIKGIEIMVESNESNAERFFEAMDNNKPNIEEEIEMNNEEIVGEVVEQELIEEVREEVEEMVNDVNIRCIDYNIRKAILEGKDLATKGINGKQLETLSKGYKRHTGTELSKERVNYLKTINEKQYTFIIYVFNAFEKRTNELKRREAQELKEQTASATN